MLRSTLVCGRFSGLLSLCLFVVATGCADPDPSVEAGPPLIVCHGAGNGAFFDTRGEVPSGVEYDLVSAFAGTLDRTVELKQLTEGFSSVFSEVEEGRCDVAAWSITSTSERAKRVDLSRPYFPVRSVLIGLRKRAQDTSAGLRGLRVGGPSGIWFQDEVLEITGEPYVAMSGGNLLEDLETGAIDALALDSSVAARFLNDRPELVVIGSLSARTEHYAFALPKGSPLTSELNRFLDSQQDDGRYVAILSKYFDRDMVTEIVDSLAESAKP